MTRWEDGHRYEQCIWCKRWYNVPTKAEIPVDGYLCPPCDYRGVRETIKRRKKQ